jgi:iron complex outermembrane receptor protein
MNSSTIPVRLLAAALVVCSASPALFAQQDMPDFALLTLEELLNVRIISAERREQRAEDVPAAVHVVTQEDIRRSGSTELPEILRLVPGVQVARLNGSEWAVSVRGFNSLYSDKLLVLIDGRSMYTRGFSGVFWDAQNIMVSDIDRIEVIRGPGGTAWGANAVNGVINIITKPAAATQGVVVEAGAGTLERSAAAVRYGGSTGDLAYRVYSRWSDHGSGLTDAGTPADDGRDALTTGGRIDWTQGRDTITLQGSYMDASAKPHWNSLTSFLEPPTSDGTSDLTERMLMARWTRESASGALFQVQAFRNDARRDERTLKQDEHTTDIETQYQTKIGARHEIVMGGGFRDSDLIARRSFTLDIPSDSAHVVNMFAQDEIALGRSVTVTVGSKLEHDTFAGWGLLPSTRVMWKLAPFRQRVWGAVSRARRTPGAAYRAMSIYWGSVPGENGLPIVFGLKGSPDYRSEELLQIDAGYRVELGGKASIDVAAFRGRYDHSTTIEQRPTTFELDPMPHVFVNYAYANLLAVDTAGVELSGRWVPMDDLRVDGSYSTIHFNPRPAPGTNDPAAAAFDGGAPRHQWQIHSTAVLAPRVQVDGGLYYVGRLRQLDVPAYARFDARAEFKLTGQLSAVVVGQNLLQRSHQEFSDVNAGLHGSSVPRSGRVQLRFQF